ncbi:hypothetical protein ACFSTD_14540 [Novosphingobium colocasiae]
MAQDTSSPADAQPAAAADQEVYPTGLQPLSPESYRKLPKLGKFRAWLPKAVDLSPLFPAPGNQTPFPNCTAWATAYAGVGYLSGVQLGRPAQRCQRDPQPHIRL